MRIRYEIMVEVEVELREDETVDTVADEIEDLLKHAIDFPDAHSVSAEVMDQEEI